MLPSTEATFKTDLNRLSWDLAQYRSVKPSLIRVRIYRLALSSVLARRCWSPTALTEQHWDLASVAALSTFRQGPHPIPGCHHADDG